MYCSKCGTNCGDEAIFCSVCGTKIEMVSEGRITQQKDILIDKNRRVEIFEKITRNLEGFEKVYNWNLTCNKRYQDFMKEKENDWLYTKVLLPLVVALVYFVLADIFLFEYKRSDLIMCAITVFLVWVLAIFYFSTKRNIYTRQKDERIAKIEEDIKKSEKKCTEFANVLLEPLKKYIPEDYWYASAVSAFTSYFRNGRADTMKDAINLYEEEMHRLRMENMQERILREHQKQSTYTGITAFSSVINTINSIR